MVLPIAYFGIPDSTDLPQHFKFAQIFYDSLNSGNYFPGWAGNENFGYGDIGIRFYPPLEYYLLAFVRIIVGNWYDAAWITFAFWMVVGSLGIYYWARCWFSVKQSALAACLYLFIPFHLNHLYVSFNNYSEFAATAVLGFCFAFLTGIFRRERASDVLGLIISFALLILLHLPTTIIGSISLFVYATTLIRKEIFLRALIKCVAAIGLAMAASAFYWIVIITEINWLNHATDRFSSGHFDFEKAFFPFSYYSDNFPETVKIADATIILTIAFFGTILFYRFYKRANQTEYEPKKEIFKTVLPLGLFTFFMVTPFSRPLWQILVPLQKVQFPSRWMNIVALCLAIITTAGIHYLIKGEFLKQRIWIYVCLIFSVTILLFDFIYILHPTSFAPYSREKFESRIQALPESESFVCWWTIWAQNSAFSIKDKVLAENRAAEIKTWEAEKREFIVSEGQPTKVRVATFYYPHWRANVNGIPAEVEKDENGVMLIPLPAKKSTVELVFQEPPIIKIASIISVASWLFLFSAFLLLMYKNFFAPKFKNRILFEKKQRAKFLL